MAEDRAVIDTTSPLPPDPATILIVDDDAAHLEALSDLLTTAGYRVVKARDGHQALEQVRRCNPDMILLDILMPRLDGYEVCKRLKNDPSTVFLPVVLITGLDGLEERIKGVEVGADDFLTKPANSLELVTRVRSLLRVKRLHDELEAHRRDLEQRVAERTGQLQRALKELRELDRLKSEFVSRVSHELRTPLQHIMGYLGLLADEAIGPLTPEQGRGLDTAVNAARQLERLVRDVVDLGSARVGPLAIRPISASEAVRVAITMVGPAAAPRRISIAADVPASLPAVMADDQALARCLRHLLDNAVKFSPVGASVEVRAQLAHHGRSVRLSVRDRGIGIPGQHLDKIFQGFYQVDGTTTRRHGGAGVGLALAKLLLEAQGSSIHVESVEGQGSQFYFELSVAREPKSVSDESDRARL